jgi:hypothetical protein
MKNLVISVSGGRSSAMMAMHINQSEKYKNYNKLFVFANTSLESEETLNFLKRLIKFGKIPLHIVEGVYSNTKGIGISYRLTDFGKIDTNGYVFKSCCISRSKGSFLGLPNIVNPYCSYDLKKHVIDKFAKDYFGTNKYITAIGFRLEDTPKRITFKEIELIEDKIFPLLTDFEEPINVLKLTNYWNNFNWKLNQKKEYGNCLLCWKKSFKNLAISIHKSNAINIIRFLEKRLKNTMYRGKISVNTLVNIKSNQLDLLEDYKTESCNC